MDVPLAVEASLPSVTGKALEDKDTPQLPYLPGTKWSRSRQFQAVGSAATKAPGSTLLLGFLQKRCLFWVSGLEIKKAGMPIQDIITN